MALAGDFNNACDVCVVKVFFAKPWMHSNKQWDGAQSTFSVYLRKSVM